MLGAKRGPSGSAFAPEALAVITTVIMLAVRIAAASAGASMDGHTLGVIFQVVGVSALASFVCWRIEGVPNAHPAIKLVGQLGVAGLCGSYVARLLGFL